VDVFHPSTGEVRSDGAEGFVRSAAQLGREHAQRSAQSPTAAAHGAARLGRRKPAHPPDQAPGRMADPQPMPIR
jgi:hypothetical protein